MPECRDRFRPKLLQFALLLGLVGGLAAGLWLTGSAVHAQIGLPTKPAIHTITGLHEGLRVYWYEPSEDGGSPLTGYDVHYRASGAQTWTDAGHAGLSQLAEIAGLRFATTYEVQVRARNANGAGPWSTTESRRTSPNDGKPDQPLPPTLEAGDGQLKVSWTAPAYTGGRAITGYRVRYTTDDAATWHSWAPGGNRLIVGTTATITGLDNGVTVGLVVAAVNARGQGRYSSPIAEATPVEATVRAQCEAGTAISNPTANTGLVADCVTLLGLRDALGGSVLLNWSPARPMTKWDGVTLSGTRQRVTKIELSNQQLSGQLPPKLGDLAQLQSLRLNRNRLTGAIPPELQQLEHLEALFLAGNSFSGCIPRGLRYIASSDLNTITGVGFCLMAFTAPTAGTVTVAVPISVQTAMIRDELAYSEAALTALEALLENVPTGTGVSGQGSDDATQIQAVITRLKAKILRLKMIKIEEVTEYNLELPIAEVQHNGIGSVAFTRFSYALDEDGTGRVVQKDPINFLFWGDASSTSFRTALEDHSRPAAETDLLSNPYRWEGDHGPGGICDAGRHEIVRRVIGVAESPFQYVLMRNTAGEWKWAKSKGLQAADADTAACMTGAERNHLRHWSSSDNNMGGSLGLDPHLQNWTIVAAHYDKEGHEPDFERGERRLLESLVTPHYPQRTITMPWVVDLQTRINFRNLHGPNGRRPQDVAASEHDGLGHIVEVRAVGRAGSAPGKPAVSDVAVDGNSLVITPSMLADGEWFDVTYHHFDSDPRLDMKVTWGLTGATGEIDNLRRGEIYRVHVFAVNRHGVSRGSATFVMKVANATATINGSTIAGDGVVNIKEKADGLDVTGTAEAEANVTLTLDSSRAADSITVKATQDGTWFVSIPGGASYVTEGQRTISVTVSKQGIGDGKADATIEVDLTSPSVSYVFDATLRIGDDVDESPVTHGHRDIKTFEEKAGALLPKSLKIDRKSGRIFGTLTEANASPDAFIVVTDNAGNATEKALTIPAIGKALQVLTGFQYVPTIATLGATAPTVHAPTGAEGTLSYSNENENKRICTVDRATGVPTMRAVGKCTVTVTAAATDRYEAATDEASFRIVSRVVTPPPDPTCPDGQDLVGGVCVPIPPPPCPTGQERVGGQCVPKCPTGEHRVNGVCVPIPPPPCPTGEHRVNGICVPIPPPPCPTGEHRVNGVCVPIPPPPCPTGEHRVNGICVPIPPPPCPTGEHRVNGNCVPIPPPPCPTGQERVGNVCLPKIPPKPPTRTVNLPSEFRTESRTTITFTGPSFCVERTLNRVVQVSVRSITTYSLVNRKWVGSTRIVRQDVSHGPWRVVSTRPCSFPALRGAEGATGFLLPAGDYVLEWGETQYGFTVPVGATVTLDGHLESGKYVAVFRQGEAELVVTPQTLGGVSGQAAPQDPTLAAISASLKAVTSVPPESSATTEHQCAVAGEGDQSATAVNLDTEPCVVVRDGGAIKSSRGGETRSLTLPAGRDWLLAGTIGKEATPAIAIVDLTTGGYLIIKAADGSKLSRNLGDGGAPLGILFDALVPATSASGDN